MKKKNSKIRRNITLGITSILIIITTIFAIILSLNTLYKMNYKADESVIVDSNEIILGEQKVLYIDLTKNPNDYQKIKKENKETQQQEKITEKNDGISKKGINSKEETTIQTYDDNKLDTVKEIDQNQSNVDNNVGKALIIETSNIEDITKTGNVESVVKIAEDIYCLHYNDEKDTEEGYYALENVNTVESICKNEKVTILENNTQKEEIEVTSQGVSGNNYVWGTESTGLGRFLTKVNYNKYAPNIKVAVLDTGVRTTHEAFKNEQTADRIDLTNSYNYVEKNTNISDNNGHGTMVAGIIAESTSNNVKIVPVKTLDSDGNGNLVDILEAIAAIKNSVDVINLSLGIDEAKLSEKAKSISEKVLKEAYDNNTVIICATGNDGKESVYYPANSEYTISVSAITSENNIATFSNYGDKVDFAAPGQALILPYYTGDNLYNSNFEPGSDEYNKNSGTSFATPFVAAAVALVKSENTGYNIEQVKNVLIQNCEDLGNAGKDKFFGYGAINFDVEMFKKPVIASVDVSNENDKVKINAFAIAGNRITNWCFKLSENEPTLLEWESIDNPVKYLHMTLTSTPNADGYLWVKDDKGNTTKQLVKIETLKYGDINENDQIDVGDVLLIQRHMAQTNSTEIARKHQEWKLNEEKLKVADVNKNNQIDVGDVLKLQRYIAATNSSEIATKHPEWLNLN